MGEEFETERQVSRRAARFGTRSGHAMGSKEKHPSGPKANNLDTVLKVIVIIICNLQI